jgi:hypothetical protein
MVSTFIAIILITLPSFAQTSRPITDERLNQCYQHFPFFLEALVLISDDDFANSTKSYDRKKIIQREFDKKSAEIRSCLDDVIQYAKNQGDDENVRYVVLRMSEISSIVYKSAPRSEAQPLGAVH